MEDRNGPRDTQAKRSKNPIAYHPFLFAVYPVLLLYVHNYEEAGISDLLKPGIAVIALTVVLLASARGLFKDKAKAALLASLTLVLILAYGHIKDPVTGLSIGGQVVGRDRFLLPLCFLVFLALAWAVVKTRRNLANANQFANMLGVVFVAITVVQIGVFESQSSTLAWHQHVSEAIAGPHALKPVAGPLPDIYYIILDTYSRADLLRDYFGHDNSDFVNHLRSKGFYVADESVSNYTTTGFSLPSSLNLAYVQSLSREAGIERVDKTLLQSMIHDAIVPRILKDAGYTFVFGPSCWAITQSNPNADVTLARGALNFTEFDQVFFATTVFYPFTRTSPLTDRRYMLRMFDEVATVAEMAEPTFTFVHMALPHRPFVFDSDGDLPPQHGELVVDHEIVDVELHKKLYVGQVKYTNKKVCEMVDRILANSDTPPIIIIQGDHAVREIKGPVGDIKVPATCILNAYYLPDGGNELLYPSVTPVNSFRIVFNHYFGADYELLDDVSYSYDSENGGFVFTRIAD